MVAVVVAPDDFAYWDLAVTAERLADMIDDAMATAVMHAPCLAGDVSAATAGAVKAIIRGAIVRWVDSGSGAYQTLTAGPFGAGMDTRQQRLAMFLPSEVQQLKELCAAASGTGSARMGWLA